MGVCDAQQQRRHCPLLAGKQLDHMEWACFATGTSRDEHTVEPGTPIHSLRLYGISPGRAEDVSRSLAHDQEKTIVSSQV
jgi:hypothetical protein